jgi:5-oxoprolinase (ATP-hydrolysing)
MDTDLPKGSSAPSPIELELFTYRFTNLVEEMGFLLQRTALSTNVKERLDFSCALLDAEGELVANAPHIPVHLGAMGLCVRSVVAHCPLGLDDMVVTNHPAFGGSHLPDVTVISAVFTAEGDRIGYVANRAHHAEIGGIRPGSMPPGAGNLVEEGVVIPPTYLFRGGEANFDEIRKLLEEAPYPSRAVPDNLADLGAQAAANLQGVRALAALASEHGAACVQAFMAAIRERATSALLRRLAEHPEGTYHGRQCLDDGSVLAVRLTTRRDSVEVDFEGTSPVHPGNLNATPAIVQSVLTYVLRLWVQEPMPLNEGLLAPVTVRLPVCMLNPEFPDDPAQCPAVVGGNVETSQRLVDTFLEALGILACGQGTMNNLIFGNLPDAPEGERFSYYETVCGGCGAGPDFDGADAVHSHMTNTAITDPEILEFRFPVRLERFEVRKGSGGVGEFRGGDGVVRELTFLRPAAVSLLTQHRVERPFGVAGGGEGLPGAQRIERVSGETIVLSAMAAVEVGKGDRLILESPGGGAWGGLAPA